MKGPGISEVVVRTATKADAADIYALLEACAPEIPLTTEGEQRQRMLRSRIGIPVSAGASQVAISKSKLVGFLLAIPLDEAGWFELIYGAVEPGSRNVGLFSKMLRETKDHASQLDAVVKNHNQSGVAERLMKAGFAETADTHFDDERAFRWSRRSTDARDIDATKRQKGL